MKVAIHQPNFLPWIGYFNKIKNSEFFVFLDDVQFERGKTYTSRTKIVDNGVENWLTIPVLNKSDLMCINEIKVDDNFIWKKKHLKTILFTYRKSIYFDEIYNMIEEIYAIESDKLVDYNIPLIESISDYLHLNTKFIKSSEFKIDKEINGWFKILEILNSVKADTYLSGSGSGSRRYINEDNLNSAKIKLQWQEYNMKQYAQFNSKIFKPNISIIDILFNQGKNSILYI